MTTPGQNLNGSENGYALQSATTTVTRLIRESIPVKVLFVGWGRSGKDEAAQFAELNLGLRYTGSTSWAAKEDVAAALGVHPQIAYDNRHKNRQFWKDYCDYLRRDDPALLARRCLAQGDIATGTRDKVELLASAPLFDHVVWVDRPGTPEDFTVTFTRDDVLDLPNGRVIANDGDLEHYHTKLIHLFRDTFLIPVRMNGYAVSLLEKEAKRE